MLIYFPVPLICLQKEQLYHLVTSRPPICCILNLYLPLTSRPMRLDGAGTTPIPINQKPPNVGAGACGIWGHREEAQRPLHETMRLAEARLERHAPGGSMPSEAPKHCKIQSRRDAPIMAILEAPCAQNAPGRSTMRPPEALLPRNPTWESPHFSGLTNKMRKLRPKLSHGEFEPPEFFLIQKYYKSVEKRKLRPWSEFPPRQTSDHGPS